MVPRTRPAYPSLAPCSPPSMTLRAASGGRLRPSLTAAARGALLTPGRDGETAPVSRTEKRYQVGSVRQTSKGRTFLPTPDSEEAFYLYIDGGLCCSVGASKSLGAFQAIGRIFWSSLSRVLRSLILPDFVLQSSTSTVRSLSEPADMTCSTSARRPSSLSRPIKKASIGDEPSILTLRAKRLPYGQVWATTLSTNSSCAIAMAPVTRDGECRGMR